MATFGPQLLKDPECLRHIHHYSLAWG